MGAGILPICVRAGSISVLLGQERLIVNGVILVVVKIQEKLILKLL